MKMKADLIELRYTIWRIIKQLMIVTQLLLTVLWFVGKNLVKGMFRR